MKTLMQYLVLGVALMLLMFGVDRMGRKEPDQEPEPITESTAVTEAPVETTVPEATEPTQPPVSVSERLQQAVQTDAMEASFVFAYDTAGQQMVLCTTSETQSLYPASITKLFSAWVALQILPADAVVTAGWELGFLQPGSSMAFIALDSRLTVEMLIEGMLLPSGNDAALVLAAAAGRRVLGKKNATASEAVAAFVLEMNRAAEAVGLQNSHFENPDGYHSENHYSCPADLARIACLALDEPVIRRCMGLQQDTVTFVSGQIHHWENTNRLLNPESDCYAPEAVGMKTGYTGKAGYCLMAAFGQDWPLVVGIFGGADPVSRYEDAAYLYTAWQSLSAE